MQLIKNIILYALAIAAAIGLVEISMRSFKLAGPSVIDKAHYPLVFIPNSLLIETDEGYGIRKANKYGFLDREYDINDSLPTRAILMGNSITEAHQVNNENLYDNLLEDKLSKNGRKVEVWNAGSDGGHLIEYLAKYQKLSKKIKFKYVILQINPEDIIHPLQAAINFKIENDSVITEPGYGMSYKPGPIENLNLKTKENSATWETFVLRMMLVKQAILGRNLKTDPADKNETDDESEIKNQIKPETIKALTHLLQIFSKEAASHNAKIFLFNYPINNNPKADEIISIACNDAGITYLDITQAIKSANENKNHPMQGFLNTKLGYGHLNEHGHQVIADILYNKLRDSIK